VTERHMGGGGTFINVYNKTRPCLQICVPYTRKNLTSCNKSANKPSTRCIRTACHKLSTGLEQLVTTLSKLSDLLQGCSDKSVTCLI
jgi:hypothetical protein